MTQLEQLTTVQVFTLEHLRFSSANCAEIQKGVEQRLQKQIKSAGVFMAQLHELKHAGLVTSDKLDGIAVYNITSSGRSLLRTATPA